MGLNFFRKREVNESLLKTAMDGDLTEAEKTLINGANVDAKDNEGWTALMIASQEEHSDIVSLLRNVGVNNSANQKLGEQIKKETSVTPKRSRWDKSIKKESGNDNPKPPL